MTTRWFPVLDHEPGGPQRVPWDFIDPHELQALRNYDQSLQRLAERGGLGVSEIVAVVEGRRWKFMDPGAAVARLRELLAAWEGSPETRLRVLCEEVERLDRELAQRIEFVWVMPSNQIITVLDEFRVRIAEALKTARRS